MRIMATPEDLVGNAMPLEHGPLQEVPEWKAIAGHITTWMESFKPFHFDSTSETYQKVCEYPTEVVIDAAFQAANQELADKRDPVQWLEAARIVAQDQYGFEDERINVVGRRCSDVKSNWERIR